MTDKDWLGLCGVAWVAIVCGDYIISVLRGRTKPHAFTWLIWALICGIIAAAQLDVGAEAGSWPVFASAFFCAVIAILSLFKGERNVTRSDTVFFAAGLAIIPFWRLTHSAFTAVILATLIDACAYVPTVRKAWVRPQEEKIFMYAADLPRWVFALAASSDFSATVLIAPIFSLVANTGLAAIIFWWRLYRKGTQGDVSDPVPE